jgi:hypothetical protein
MLKIFSGRDSENTMKIKHKKDIHPSLPIAAEPQNICSEGQLDEAAPKKTVLN